MANFPEHIVSSVWQKADTVDGYDSNFWCKDFACAWIRRDHYGVESKYGWEIDHLKPSAQGGSDELYNLNALHWRNNRKKSGNYLRFQTVISAEKKYQHRKHIVMESRIVKLDNSLNIDKDGSRICLSK